MADPREVEIKLELPEAEAKALDRNGLKGFGAAAASREKLSSTYFDTPKNTLKKKGLSLRVRATKDGHVQTVKKSNGHSFGLFDRSEWETGVVGLEPEHKALSKTPVAKALSKRNKLRPVFKTVVERTSWLVPSGQSTVEIALDRGQVTAGQDSRSFAEIELELKTGTPADLFALARKLGARQSLRLGVVTKSERGYALAARAA